MMQPEGVPEGAHPSAAPMAKPGEMHPVPAHRSGSSDTLSQLNEQFKKKMPQQLVTVRHIRIETLLNFIRKQEA